MHARSTQRDETVAYFMRTCVQLNVTTGLSEDFGNHIALGLCGDCFENPEAYWEKGEQDLREYIWRGLPKVPHSYEDWVHGMLPRWNQDLAFHIVMDTLGLNKLELQWHNRATALWHKVHWLTRMHPLSADFLINQRNQAQINTLNQYLRNLQACGCCPPAEIDLERVRALMVEIEVLLKGEEQRERLVEVYYPNRNGRGDPNEVDASYRHFCFVVVR